MYADEHRVDLGLSQILAEDETGAELKVVSASIVDPYVLLIRDDASIYLAACDKHNDLEEMSREDDALLANKWLSGCLYKDTTGTFSNGKKDTVIMSLLNTDGALFVRSISPCNVDCELTPPDVCTARSGEANIHSQRCQHTPDNHLPRLRRKARCHRRDAN